MEKINKTYKGYLIDLDGTVYRGKQALPEAHAFIHHLRQKGIPFLFLTNNSTTPPGKVAERLRTEFNIEAQEKDIYTSAMSAASFVSKHAGKTAYVLGEEGLKEAIKSAGLKENSHSPDFVIVGLHRTVTYKELEIAVLGIHQGAEYILTNGDGNYPTERGLLPGAGSIGALIEKAGKKKPTITGKPEKYMLDAAIEKLNVKKEDVLIIGDNLDTDIMGGIKNGIDTLLVLTGVSTEQEVNELNIHPTYIRNNLGEWTIE